MDTDLKDPKHKMKNNITLVRYLSTKDAANYLTISERKLRYLRSAGEIKAVRISKGRIAYRIVDLERYVLQNLEK